jgi:hypothetical protein
MASREEAEGLAGRIRSALAGRPGLSEQHKMGGTTFLIDGKVCVRAHRDGELMVRCRPERTEELLLRPGARRFEMTGKPDMKGWLLVEPSAFAADADFGFWMEIGLQACAEAPAAKRRA